MNRPAYPAGGLVQDVGRTSPSGSLVVSSPRVDSSCSWVRSLNLAEVGHAEVSPVEIGSMEVGLVEDWPWRRRRRGPQPPQPAPRVGEGLDRPAAHMSLWWSAGASYTPKCRCTP